MKRFVTGMLAMLSMGVFSATALGEWSITGAFTEIRALDCRNCGENLGLVFACTGNGQPAEITVQAAASRRGRQGAFAPVTFTIDNRRYTYDAKTVEFGAIGFTPVFQIAQDDPLTNALQAGRQATVSFNGQRSNLTLKGSRSALAIFKAHCGWTPQGFQQNLQRAAAQSGGQQQSQQPDQSQGQSTVFGVEAGEAHTKPDADGNLWFTSGFVSGGNQNRQITYGQPETDAIAMVASCDNTDTYSMDLMINAGNRRANTPVDVEFGFGSRLPAALVGRVFKISSEFAGVRLKIKGVHPFWKRFATEPSVSIGIIGDQKITLPGAGVAGQYFLSQCDKGPSQPAPPIQAAAPAPQPSKRTLSKIFNVSCPNGSSFRVQFAESETASTAILYPGLPQQLILNSIPTGSGSAYQNGPLKIYTGRGRITVETATNTAECSMQ